MVNWGSSKDKGNNTFHDACDPIELLKNFKQMIFYGPPGTGKTTTAREIAQRLVDFYSKNNKCKYMDYILSNIDCNNYMSIIVNKFLNNKGCLNIMLSKFSWEGKSYETYKLEHIYLNDNAYKLGEYELLSKNLTIFVHINQDNQASSIYLGYIDDIQQKREEDKDSFEFNIKLCVKLPGKVVDELYKYIKDKSLRWYIYTPNSLIYESVKQLFDSQELGNIIDYINHYIKIVQFHPSYNYDDFVQGIEVRTENNYIKYVKENKIFIKMCEKAQRDPDCPYILIIDEINRANLPEVIGELIYAMEYRNKEISILSGDTLIIPDNLYIIGTMNTADKSAGRIDYAIRRRFIFYPIYADLSKVTNDMARELMRWVNHIIETKVAPDYDPEDIKIGHSYFIGNDEKEILCKFLYQVIPLIYEYATDGLISLDKDGNVYKIEYEKDNNKRVFYIKGGSLYYKDNNILKIVTSEYIKATIHTK